MISVSVEIKGLRDLRGRFARVESQLQIYRREELSIVLSRLVSMLRIHAPKRTGRFAKSLSGKLTPLSSGELGIRVFSSDPKASLIVKPTAPHTIVAVRGKALRFMKGDEVVFRQRVRHPGTKGSDFIQDVFYNSEVDFIRHMNRAGVRAIVYLAGR